MTELPDRPLSAEAIQQALDAFRAEDAAWADGRTFGHAFLDDESQRRASEQAHTAFLWENGLDPTMFPSLVALEKAVVDIVAGHVGAPAGCQGLFTSGGTESVFLATLAARERFRQTHGTGRVPRIVVASSAHPCVHKAAWYLGMAVDSVPVGPDLRVDPSAFAEVIGPDTAMLYASAPAYAHGVLDPIGTLGALALERDLWLHVDACIGGFLLPLYAELGDDLPPWSLDVPGVSSLSVDLHKYALCPKGASVVLFRGPELRRLAAFGFSDWSGYALINPTMQSSRSGGPLAAAWATLHHVGREGYLDMARTLRDATRRIREGLEARGLRVLGEPAICLLGLDPGELDAFALVDGLKARGWRLYPQFSKDGLGPTLHLTVVPRNAPRVDEFLADLDAVLDEVRRQEPPGPGLDADSVAMFAAMDDATLEALISEMAPDGDDEGMATINRLLDALDPTTRDRVLVLYDDRMRRIGR